MKSSVIRLLLAAIFAAVFAVSAQAQSMAPGQIKAAKVEHQVMKLVKGKAPVQLKDGDDLTESDTVTTGKDSSAVLVFMNGSSVKLGPDSELKIDEFKMDPLAVGTQVKMAGITDEPSTSVTQLNLSHGELVGNVRKLHTGSAYTVKTPVGAAGIRGTTFRIVFIPDKDGKAFFTVSTAEGKIVMQGVTKEEISIPAGKEVVVTADVPSPGASGSSTSSSGGSSGGGSSGGSAAIISVQTQDIPPATTSTITTAAGAITQILQSTTFTQDTPVVSTTAVTQNKGTQTNLDNTPGAGGK